MSISLPFAVRERLSMRDAIVTVRARVTSLTFYDEWDSYQLDIIDGFARPLTCYRRSAHCPGSKPPTFYTSRLVGFRLQMLSHLLAHLVFVGMGSRDGVQMLIGTTS